MAEPARRTRRWWSRGFQMVHTRCISERHGCHSGPWHTSTHCPWVRVSARPKRWEADSWENKKYFFHNREIYRKDNKCSTVNRKKITFSYLQLGGDMLQGLLNHPATIHLERKRHNVALDYFREGLRHYTRIASKHRSRWSVTPCKMGYNWAPYVCCIRIRKYDLMHVCFIDKKNSLVCCNTSFC